jgi:hypothetical protein
MCMFLFEAAVSCVCREAHLIPDQYTDSTVLMMHVRGFHLDVFATITKARMHAFTIVLGLVSRSS